MRKRSVPSLARQLQHAFAEHCPAGWQCVPEARAVAVETEAVLGYAPQADLLFREALTGRRVWVELEVSRADPVANHAKFASAHLVTPFPASDTFLAMVSNHVARGRRNLAAHTIGVMRALGIWAFQTIPYEHPIFDGGRAWQHLQNSLGFDAVPLTDLPKPMINAFSRWLDQTGDSITVDGKGPVILLPPLCRLKP